MQTDQFIAFLAEPGEQPGHQVTPDDELRAYANAVRMLEELGPRIAQHTKSPTHAAYFVYEVERAHHAAEYAQLLAASLAQHTLVHELPGHVFEELQRLRIDPDGYICGTFQLPADPRTVPTGRPLFKNTAEFLAQTLKITFPEAQDRLLAADTLLPYTDIHGIARQAHFPVLGRQLADGTAAPHELKNAARRLTKMQPHVNAQPNGDTLGPALEEQVADSVRVQGPDSTKKLLTSMESELAQKTPKPTEEILRENLGMFYRGTRGGIAEFRLRMLPADAEILLSLRAQADNPRTKAGNRETLLQQSPFAVPVLPTPPMTSARPESTGTRDPHPGPDFLRNPITGQPLTATEVDSLSLDGPQPLSLAAGEQDSSASSTATSESTPETTSDATAVAPDSAASSMRATELGFDGLTPAQRHLQALINLIRVNGLPGNNRKTAGLPAPEMFVIVELSELEERATRGGITSHGQHLDPATLRQELCSANVIPVVMNGKGQIVDLGRAGRFFPDYMRRAILARDGGCIVPGCRVPPEHCEIHHVKPWESGGTTCIDDGFPHCSVHHHAVHAGQIRDVRNDEGLPAVILPRFIDPEQLPRRNTYWNPRPLALRSPSMLPRS